MFNAIPAGIQLLRGLLDRGYAREAGAVVNALTRSVNAGLIARRLDELEIEAHRLAALGLPMLPDNPVLRALLADLESTMRANARLIDGAAPNLMTTAADAAQTFTGHVTVAGLPMDQAFTIRQAWNRPDPEAVASLLEYANSRDWEAEINAFGGNMAGRVREIALRGIVAGRNPLAVAREVAEAVQGIPRHTAETMMRTLQLQSYRKAEATFYAANAHIIDHRIRIAALDDRTCMSCVYLHGAKLKADELVLDHHKGRCTSIGVVKGMTRKVQNGEEWFAKRTEAQQRKQMGDAAFDAWKAGKLELHHFVHRYEDRVFGPMLQEASLKGILGPEGAKKYYRGASPAPAAPTGPVSVTELFGKSALHDEHFGDVLRIIDGVHQIGPVTGDLVMVQQEAGAFQDGHQVLGRWRVKENKLFYDPTQSDIRGTLLHETGHGLDWRVFGNGKYYGSDLASIGEGPLVGWFQAVRATEAFKAIEEIRLTEDNNWIYSNNDRRFASYLNGTRELFARSYHQYIATKSGDAVTRSELGLILQRRSWSKHEQWTRADFEPVVQALDEMFKGLGWLR
jgi:hypothetical protein